MAVGDPIQLGYLQELNDASTYNVSVTTPTAGRMIVVNVCTSLAAGATAVVIGTGSNGCGVTTWNQTSLQFNSTQRRLTVAYGFTGSPVAGPIQITFSGGVTQNSCLATVYEIPDVDTASPLGQTVKTAASASLSALATVAISNLANAGNGYFAAIGVSAIRDVTPRTSWTESQDIGTSSPGSNLFTEYRLGANDTAASGTWATNAHWAIIAIEFAQSAGAAPASLVWSPYRMRPLLVR